MSVDLINDPFMYIEVVQCLYIVMFNLVLVGF